MMWLIFTLIFVLVGITLIICGLIRNEEELTGWGVICLIIGVLIFPISFKVGSYKSDFKIVKGLEKEIPLQKQMLAEKEGYFSLIEQPKSFAEFDSYAQKKNEIDALRQDITQKEISYNKTLFSLSLTNKWTNIYVLFNGKFKGTPAEF